MISDKSIDFFERRSAEVLRLCDLLAGVMNRVHDVEFSTKFWTRVLISYATAAYNQKDYYRKADFTAPVPFQEINGWKPAGRREIQKHRAITSLRAARGKVRASHVGNALKNTKRVALGIRKEAFADQLNATPLSFNWAFSLGRPQITARVRLLSEAKHVECSFERNTIQHAPKLYVEYFAKILQILKGTETSPVDSIFFEHPASNFEVILSAYLSECGKATIYQLQQGGFVGETTISVAPDKRRLYDYLLTYGWSIGSQDIPFYAVRLEEFRKRYQSHQPPEPELDILFVYGAPENSKALKEHYARCTRAANQKLDRVKFKRIRFRPRAKSRKLRLTEPPTTLDQIQKSELCRGHKDIAELCATSSVVVQWMTPSTNFLECIFVDHPVVAVDTNNMATDVLRPFKAFFKEAGVFHDTPEALVHFLNRTDIEQWWRNLVKDSSYKAFKTLFTRSYSAYRTDDKNTI